MFKFSFCFFFYENGTLENLEWILYRFELGPGWVESRLKKCFKPLFWYLTRKAGGRSFFRTSGSDLLMLASTNNAGELKHYGNWVC